MPAIVSPATGRQFDVEQFFRTPRRSREERAAAGERLRADLPLESLSFVPQLADRRPALEILAEQEEARLQQLLALRHERMGADAFAFLRGAAAVMASDISAGPSSSIKVQLCGDAHVANFGMYASPERDLVFDLNDFDETLPGPFEWDVKRLAASLVVAGDAAGLKPKQSRRAAVAAAETYRTSMATLAGMPTMDVWFARLDFSDLLEHVKKTSLARAAKKAGEKSRSRTRDSAVAKLTEIVDGKLRFRQEPPELVRVNPQEDDATTGDLARMYGRYLSTLNADRLALLIRFSYLDLAHKVVGVGSVGTRALVLLLESGDGQPLILQIKEASQSALEPYLGASNYDQHGHRVVAGQRVMQSVSDPFLGWCTSAGEQPYHFFVRQLRDMKGSIETEGLDAEGLLTYARICGGVLARAHARGGDAATIAGYLGRTAEFDEAIGGFAVGYRDINAHDHGELLASMGSGAAGS